MKWISFENQLPGLEKTIFICHYDKLNKEGYYGIAKLSTYGIDKKLALITDKKAVYPIDKIIDYWYWIYAEDIKF